MAQFELILALLVAISVLALAAERLRVPFPVTLVLGGLALGFVPGLPAIQLTPDVVFTLFLPPLVYIAAQATSARELRLNLQPILSLAIGLTLASVVCTAVAVHLVVRDLDWFACFVLGAILAPTDPIAVSAVTHRLSAPRRLLTIVEAESLVNDAVGLVVYRIAIAAAVSGTFSLWRAGGEFVIASALGIVVGLAVGAVALWIHRRLNHTSVEITIMLLTPYAAYLAATQLGVSGVLAVTAAGIYLARHSSTMLEPETRLQAAAVWEMIGFLLNGLLFILLGVQLHRILADVSASPRSELALGTLVVCLAVVGVRLLWVATSELWTRALARLLQRDERDRSWRESAAIGWTGMRGSASIAAALAVPYTVNGGAPFPGRSLIAYLVFCAILVTLVLQGLSLPWLIHRLGLSGGEGRGREERCARLEAARAGLARVATLAGEEWIADDTFDRVLSLYKERVARLAHTDVRSTDGAAPLAGGGYAALRLEGLQAEREAVIHLRNQGRIDDATLRTIERGLDLEESHLRGALP
jgi:CPA1 family monovalent cation:H+ antiporter